MPVHGTRSWAQMQKEFLQRCHTYLQMTRNCVAKIPASAVWIWSPKSLVAGAPPDPLAVMGWDGDLVTNLVRVNYVPPCSSPVTRCCFEAGYEPGSNLIFLPIASQLCTTTLKEVPHIHILNHSHLCPLQHQFMPLLHWPCLTSKHHAASDLAPIDFKPFSLSDAPLKVKMRDDYLNFFHAHLPCFMLPTCYWVWDSICCKLFMNFLQPKKILKSRIESIKYFLLQN